MGRPSLSAGGLDHRGELARDASGALPRQGELVVRACVGPLASLDPRREIFVDADHEETLSGSGEVWIVYAQQGIVGGDGVEARLELVSQVFGREPSREVPIGLRQTRIARVAASAPFLEQPVIDAHATVIPRSWSQQAVDPTAQAPHSVDKARVSRLLVIGQCHTPMSAVAGDTQFSSQTALGAVAGDVLASRPAPSGSGHLQDQGRRPGVAEQRRDGHPAWRVDRSKRRNNCGGVARLLA